MDSTMAASLPVEPPPPARRPHGWLPGVVLLAALCLQGLFVAVGMRWCALRGTGQDFFVIYTATRRASDHLNPYGREYVEQALRTQWWGDPTGSVAAGFFYPPQLFVLLLPFAWLPVRAAVVGWYLANVGLIVACGSLAWFADRPAPPGRRAGWLAAAVVAAVFLLNPLSQRTLSLGQTSFLVPGAVAIGHLLIVRGWRWAGAIAWSFAAAKPHLALPLLALMPLLYGLPVTLACAAGVCGGNLVGCWVTTGTLHTLLDFAHDAQASALTIGFNQVQSDQILSWNRLLYLATGRAINLTATAIVAGYALAGCLLYARTAAAAGRRPARPSQALLLAWAAAVSLFCSQAKGYDLVVAVLVVPHARDLWRGGGRGTVLVLIALALVALIPRGAWVGLTGHAHLGGRATAAVLSYRTFVVAALLVALLARGNAAEPESVAGLAVG